MPREFPGMNPFIEASRWPSFHTALNIVLLEQLVETLPPHYDVTVEEEAIITESRGTPDDTSDSLGESDGDRVVARRRPDVAVSQVSSLSPEVEGSATATLAPPSETEWFDVDVQPLDRLLHRWLEIRTADSREIVTVIETLSPTNKSGTDRDAYLGKRETIFQTDANLIELDLLLGGRRLPPLDTLTDERGRHDYYVLVSDASKRPRLRIAGWSMRQRCPDLSVPLAPSENAVTLSLQNAIDTVLKRTQLTRHLKYDGAALSHFPSDARSRIAAYLEAS